LSKRQPVFDNSAIVALVRSLFPHSSRKRETYHLLPTVGLNSDGASCWASALGEDIVVKLGRELEFGISTIYPHEAFEAPPLLRFHDLMHISGYTSPADMITGCALSPMGGRLTATSEIDGGTECFGKM
jgi:hypothetical protein